MNTLDVSVGTFMIGMIEGSWTIHDVVEGKQFVERFVEPTPKVDCPLKLRVIWTTAYVKGDTFPYLNIIALYNEAIFSGKGTRATINNIVRELFSDNEKADSNNTSLSGEVLLTIFLQSVYVSIRASLTNSISSTLH